MKNDKFIDEIRDFMKNDGNDSYRHKYSLTTEEAIKISDENIDRLGVINLAFSLGYMRGTHHGIELKCDDMKLKNAIIDIIHMTDDRDFLLKIYGMSKNHGRDIRGYKKIRNPYLTNSDALYYQNEIIKAIRLMSNSWFLWKVLTMANFWIKEE